MRMLVTYKFPSPTRIHTPVDIPEAVYLAAPEVVSIPLRIDPCVDAGLRLRQVGRLCVSIPYED